MKNTVTPILLFCLIVMTIHAAVAQTDSGGDGGSGGRTPPESQSIVPNLTGLSVPEAAAQLNQAGLRLGESGFAAWTAESGGTINTISAQSIEAGGTAEPGAVVDVTVWRAHQAMLIYDDNDLTLRNTSSERLALRRVVFRSMDGSAPTLFDATAWGNRLGAGACVQLWSVARTSGKEVEGCLTLESWLSFTVPDAHFWTGANGTTRFEIVQDGIQRGVCEIATGSCEFYLAPSETRGGIAPDVAEYLTLRYTPAWLQLVNRAGDRWLPTADLEIAGVRVGDAAQFTPALEVAMIGLLAPRQCLIWQVGETMPTKDCDTIAVADVATAFWATGQPFEAGSTVNSGGLMRPCPPAQADRAVVCVLPRLESVE